MTIAPPMSYTEDIVRPLNDTLAKTAGLPTFQLAGHVPNLLFWMKEVRHALDVIADYPRRYAKMLEAQAAFDEEHPEGPKSRQKHEYDYQPARLALTPALAMRLSHELIATAERLINRCLKEELIDLVMADDLKEAFKSNPPSPTS